MDNLEDYLASLPDDLVPFARTPYASYYNYNARVVKKVPLNGCPADVVDRILCDVKLLKFVFFGLAPSGPTSDLSLSGDSTMMAYHKYLAIHTTTYPTV